MSTQFFYLACKSNFDTRAVGPWTRYGHAKGAWQFIPETGRRCWPEPGLLVDTNQYDPLDERHDFALAADAAGEYLHDIYVHLAQASGRGLRVVQLGRGPRPPHGRDPGALGGPGSRTTPLADPLAVSDAVPRGDAERDQGRDEHFAAAVIGQNPRMFGIDMDLPIQVALAGGRGDRARQPDDRPDGPVRPRRRPAAPRRRARRQPPPSPPGPVDSLQPAPTPPPPR